jgi:catechol 2,3-dioxygenase-like lactoylglutathione lyase family enzyme
MKFNKIIPELSVANLDKSIEFYKNLGFKIEYERKENKFVFISLEGSQLMLQEISQNDKWKTGKLEYPFGRGINLQIEVKDVETLYNKLKSQKYPIKIELKENQYRKNNKLLRCKEFLILDPDGYLLRFSQDLGEKEA